MLVGAVPVGLVYGHGIDGCYSAAPMGGARTIGLSIDPGRRGDGPRGAGPRAV